MEPHSSQRRGCGPNSSDHGPAPFTANIPSAASHNPNFRTAFWTGTYLQMTLMEIPAGGEIGLELHPDTDQFIRVEQGCALVRMGARKDRLDFQRRLSPGDGVFVPAGTWHNLCNGGDCPLKLSSIYAPPHHPKGTVHRTKADADQGE
ncbi:MAG: cupin domain-containing protein [Acutalibacter sp.]|jgi:mannose-6-phosphate isomerase-like protein (cupin superfamily)